MVTVYNTPLSTTSEKALFGRPGGGGASGGSLRSSRQAAACHPFTRSWATMPPEPPPPPGPLCHMVFQLWKYARARPHKIQGSKRLSSLGRGEPFAAAPRRPVGR